MSVSSLAVSLLKTPFVIATVGVLNRNENEVDAILPLPKSRHMNFATFEWKRVSRAPAFMSSDSRFRAESFDSNTLWSVRLYVGLSIDIDLITNARRAEGVACLQLTAHPTSAVSARLASPPSQHAGAWHSIFESGLKNNLLIVIGERAHTARFNNLNWLHATIEIQFAHSTRMRRSG